MPRVVLAYYHAFTETEGLRQGVGKNHRRCLQPPRSRGQWRDPVRIPADFDDLPAELVDAFSGRHD